MNCVKPGGGGVMIWDVADHELHELVCIPRYSGVK